MHVGAAVGLGVGVGVGGGIVFIRAISIALVLVLLFDSAFTLNWNLPFSVGVTSSDICVLPLAATQTFFFSVHSNHPLLQVSGIIVM